MKSLCVPVFLCMASLQWIYAQENPNLDSIKQSIAAAHDTVKVSSYLLLFNKTVGKQPDLSKAYLDSAFAISEKLKDKLIQAQVYHNLGKYHYRRSEFYDAEAVIKKEVAILELVGKKEQLSKTLRNLGMIQGEIGDYEESIDNLMYSLQLREELGLEPMKKVPVYLSLAKIHGTIDNYKESNTYNKKVEEIYLENNKEHLLPIVWNNFALNYKKLDDYQKALHYYNKCAVSYEGSKNDFKLALTYNNLADLYLEVDSLNLANEYATKAMKVGKVSKNNTQIASSLFYLGLINLQKQNFKEAVEYFEQSEQMSLQSGRTSFLMKTYPNLAKAHSRNSNYKMAYGIMLKYRELKDSILNQNSIDKINELERKYQSEKKEQEITLQKKEIETLEQRAKISNLQRLLFGTGLMLSLGIIGVGFYGFKQKIKRSKAEKEKVDAELAFKKKELTTHALHLAKKNEVLESVKQKAKELQSNKNPSGYEQLIKTINFDQQDDKNWENFTQYFEQVHKNFASHVRIKYPEVTKNELRFMALIKMNLSSKEIATILNITADGVKKIRQRLRKKMSLKPQDSLEKAVSDL